MSEIIIQRDRVIHQRIQELVKSHRISTVVETGTYEGEGALSFGQFVPLVVSSEIVSSYHEAACRKVIDSGYPWHWVNHGYMRAFCGKNGWIVLVRGHSPSVIRNITSDISKPLLREGILWFLDAHWLEQWPLQDELKAIKEANVPESVIVIHDFKSPGTNLQHDSYHGQALDLDYVKGPLLDINPKYKLEWNTQCEMVDGRGTNGVGILYAYPPLE